jgi:hypothetical protein
MCVVRCSGSAGRRVLSPLFMCVMVCNRTSCVLIVNSSHSSLDSECECVSVVV